VSLFRWLFPKPVPSVPTGHTAVLAQEGAVAPYAALHKQPHVDSPPVAQSLEQNNTKSWRAVRREALYGVIRDVMMRVGILSSAYKFKVLSLDQDGIKFLVMVDLAPEYVNDAARLNDIEGQLAQEAHVRCRILVTAVYWRANGAFLGAGKKSTPPIAPHVSHVSRPMPSHATAPQPVRPTTSVPVAPAPAVLSQIEPVEPDEVAAFRQALVSAAASQHSASLAAPTDAPQPSFALTGFEDTKVPEIGVEESRPDQLSMGTTQYGSLPS